MPQWSRGYHDIQSSWYWEYTLEVGWAIVLSRRSDTYHRRPIIPWGGHCPDHNWWCFPVWLRVGLARKTYKSYFQQTNAIAQSLEMSLLGAPWWANLIYKAGCARVFALVTLRPSSIASKFLFAAFLASLRYQRQKSLYELDCYCLTSPGCCREADILRSATKCWYSDTTTSAGRTRLPEVMRQVFVVGIYTH